ncbi:hypothetical protein [Halonatronum saccharophilum]|uniref:hypothetical protein n=1 Tax=Halonatronum saccharophilum TaxID=150060 RepID=UPI000484DB4C|nr:hypothetical protein [Halonatronum saccharophilum]
MEEKRIDIRVDDLHTTELLSEFIYNSLLEAEEEIRDFKSQFLEDGQLVYIVISFVLGNISIGFLEEIGKSIWDSIKGIFAGKDERFPDEEEMPVFEFKFNYKGVEVKARVKNKDLDKLEWALKLLKDLVKELKEEDDTLKEIDLFFNGDKDKWIYMGRD